MRALGLTRSDVEMILFGRLQDGIVQAKDLKETLAIVIDENNRRILEDLQKAGVIKD